MNSLANLVVDANSVDQTHTALVYFRAGVGWVADCESCSYGAWDYQRSGAVDVAKAHLLDAHGAGADPCCAKCVSGVDPAHASHAQVSS